MAVHGGAGRRTRGVAQGTDGDVAVVVAGNAAPPSTTSRRAGGLGRGIAAGFLFGLVFWAAVLFSLAIASSFAYRPLDNTWQKLEIGYSADPAVAGYTANGMAQWAGASALSLYAGGGDIRVVVGELKPPIYYPNQTAQANLVQGGGQITYCEVRLDPVHFMALNEAGRQNTVTHEIGHCLGLDHSQQPSVMMNPLFYGFGADDMAGIAALYPAPAPAATEPPAPVATEPPAPAATQPPAPAQPPVVMTREAKLPPAVATPRAANMSAPAQPDLAQPAAAAPATSFARRDAAAADPASLGADVVMSADGRAWFRALDGAFGWLSMLPELEPGASYIVR